VRSFFASTQPRHPIYQIFGVTTLLWSLISGPATAAQTTGLVKLKSLTLGLVSGTSQKEIEAHFQGFIRYVAGKLGAGPEQKERWNKQGAAVFVLRRWKSGMAEYRGLIYSKKDSETNRLEQREELVRRALVETFCSR
jgi:hypothetical protein